MANEQLVAHCAELLAPLGAVRTRRMFGGHGFYLDGLFIALVAFDRFYLKTDASSQAHFAAAGGEPFTYDGGSRTVTLNYWTAPADAMESPALMAPWARRAVQAALTAAALKRRPPREPKPAGERATSAVPARPAPATRRRAR